MFCTFSYVFHNENPPKIKVKHSQEQFGLYNPKCWWVFQHI